MVPLFLCLLVMFTGSPAETKEDRIHDGNYAKKDQFPFAIEIMTHNGQMKLCSGSIINPSWVLTALGCIKSYENNPQSLTIVTGIDFSEQMDSYDVEKVILQPKFEKNCAMDAFRIGLIKIQGKFEEAPVTLGGFPRNPNVTVVGYGWTKKSSNDAWKLKYANLQLTGEKFIEHVALAHEGNVFPQLGDAGGPVLSDQDHQFAVYTFHNTKNGTLYMTVIDDFRTWIDETMTNN